MRAASEDDEDETEKARRPQSARGEGDDEDEGDEDEGEVDADKAVSDDDDDDDEDDDEKDATKAAKTLPRAKGGAGISGGDASRPPQGRSSKPAEKANDEDDLVLPPSVKNAVLRVLAQALERLMGVANRVKEAEEPDDETDVEVPDDLAGFSACEK